MQRLTKPLGEHQFCLADDAATHLAVDKLAKLENLCDDIAASQLEISAQLELLRSEGKTKSCKFRELMGEKLVNSSILSRFKVYGLY